MKRCLRCRSDYDSSGFTCVDCGFAPPQEAGVPLFAPELAHGGDGLDADYLFEELAAAEPRHFWFRARRDMILATFARYFGDARSFLDIGCGAGYVLLGVRERFPDVRAAGAELRIDGLALAARRVAGVPFLQMDARRMPFTREYDVIGAFDMIEHVPEDEAVLAEMFRAVRPGGGILLTVPQHRQLWSAADEYAHHQRRYSRRELVDKVRAAGFEVLRATSFFSLMLPMIAAARWSLPLWGKAYDFRSELRLHPLNGALYALMRLEHALVGRGLSLPAGGSLLLAARRPA